MWIEFLVTNRSLHRDELDGGRLVNLFVARINHRSLRSLTKLMQKDSALKEIWVNEQTVYCFKSAPDAFPILVRIN